jgi:mannose-6-phosphate isomerase-like protein (cupin superfamily)
MAGRGVSVCDGEETPLQPDMALWVLPGEKHQLINTGHETLKLVTFFIPAYTEKELVGGIMSAAMRGGKQA